MLNEPARPSERVGFCYELTSLSFSIGKPPLEDDGKRNECSRIDGSKIDAFPGLGFHFADCCICNPVNVSIRSGAASGLRVSGKQGTKLGEERVLARTRFSS